MLVKPRISREPVRFGAQVFLPINIDAVRVDSVPMFDLYFRPGVEQPFVLYCQKNTSFTRDAIRRLAVHRVDQLFIQQDSLRDYNRYLADNIEHILSDKKLSVKEKSSILYDSAQAVVEEVLAEPASRENVRRGKDIVGHTVGFMTEKDFKLEHLLRAMSSDQYLYTHAVNVATYAVALAMRAGYLDKAILREVANGALLHDVGKARVDEKLLQKAGALTPSEWERLQQVPKLGYEMMKSTDCLGEIALDIILNHQEKLNGRGYPGRLKSEQISPFVRIVTIADVFDALTSERFHQKERSSFAALQLMQQDMRGDLDPELFKTFVGMLGNP